MSRIRYVPTTLDEIRDEIRLHLSTTPGRVESFMEEHIRGSAHYRTEIDGEAAGYAAIHGGSLITQFALEPAFGQFGQQAFRELRRMEMVTSAFVPTCDEPYLACALDDYRSLAKQAHVFSERPRLSDLPDPSRYRQTPLQPADAEMIRSLTGDFFEPIEARIDRRELFGTWSDGEMAGIGIIERSGFYADAASVGMFTFEAFRGSGVGTATIRLMIEVAHGEGRRALAGCWYYNHASKRTLERAGLYAASRLLRVEF